MDNDSPEEKPTCPECSLKLDDNVKLGYHRYREHGVHGSPYREKSKRGPGRPKKIPLVVAAASVLPAEPPLVMAEEDPGELMLGYAMGRLEALAEQIAKENGLSVKDFVPRVAQYFAAVTVRD